MKRSIVHIFASSMMLLCTCSTAMAQGYTVFVDLDKKVIKVDSLGLPKSFRAAGILRMLPELLERPENNTMINDYDIQVEDMSVGDNADVVLSELQLADIDKIEVSEDPISSYQHNGQGGTIKFFLKKKDKGTWGSASIDGTTEKDLSPQFLINHNSGKLLVRGMMLGEFYDTYISQSITTAANYSERTNYEKFQTELGRVYFEYTPTAKDIYKLKLSESYSHDKESFTHTIQKNINKTTTLKALFNYKHNYNPKSNLEFEIQYNYVPEKKEISDYINSDKGDFDQNSNITTRTLGGKLEYKRNLLRLDKEDYANLTVGVNANYTSRDKDFDKLESGEIVNDIVTKGHTTYLSPYFNIENHFGKFKFKIAAEYQYFNYKVRRSEAIERSVGSNDLTGKFMLSWQFAQNQHLRFIADRKLNRPSNEQVYPEKVYDPEMQIIILGNQSLKPILSHELSLDYISNYKWVGHKLTVNFGVSYNFISRLFHQQYNNGDESTIEDDYLSYVNQGENKLLNVNLMALYGYKTFTLSLAANVFRNDRHTDENGDGVIEIDHSHFYNIALSPAFDFKNGWMAYMNLTYYSKFENSGYEFGDCLEGQLKVGKNWGPLNVHCFGRMSITGQVKNPFSGGMLKTDLIRDNVGVGVRYQF